MAEREPGRVLNTTADDTAIANATSATTAANTATSGANSAASGVVDSATETVALLTQNGPVTGAETGTVYAKTIKDLHAEAVTAQGAAEDARDLAIGVTEATNQPVQVTVLEGQYQDFALTDAAGTARYTNLQQDGPEDPEDVEAGVLVAGPGNLGATTPNRVLRVFGRPWMSATTPETITVDVTTSGDPVTRTFHARLLEAGLSAADQSKVNNLPANTTSEVARLDGRIDGVASGAAHLIVTTPQRFTLAPSQIRVLDVVADLGARNLDGSDDLLFIETVTNPVRQDQTENENPVAERLVGDGVPRTYRELRLTHEDYITDGPGDADPYSGEIQVTISNGTHSVQLLLLVSEDSELGPNTVGRPELTQAVRDELDAKPTKAEAGYTYVREEYSSREHVPTRVLLPGQRRSWVWTSDEKREKPLFWVDGDQYADEVAQDGDYLKTLTAPVTVTSAEETADALSAIVAASGGSPLTVAFPAAVSDIPAAVLGSQLWPAPDIYNTWHATPDTASANGTTIASGQSLLVVHTGTAPTNDIENGFIVGPDTSNAGDWSLYLVPIDAAADAVGRLHKGFFAMREKQSTSGGGIVLAYDSVTGNYLWAGVRANSNLSVGVSVSGSDTTIGSGTLGTNGHRGINGEMRAALNERFSTLQQFVRVQFWANLNTDISGNANALAIIAAATHVGVFLHRDSLAQSYASRLARP